MTAQTQIEIAVATAQIADACVRLKIPYKVAPSSLRAVVAPESMVFGPVIPARHYGSVDVFFEAFERLPSNAILVVDNGGRTDEACIGDLVVIEAKLAGVQAIVVWGLHRDTKDLKEIGLPVYSYGSTVPGPVRLEKREPEALSSARMGDFLLTKTDTAFLDQDGAIFVETVHVEEVLKLAKTIRQTERQQAELAGGGLSLRNQFQFHDYLKSRNESPEYTFREHLRKLAKSIEE